MINKDFKVIDVTSAKTKSGCKIGGFGNFLVVV
jgi:hypothetical protein